MSGTVTGAAVPVSLWRNRDYLLYRSARVVSMLGSQMTSLAGPLLALGLGGGAVQAGAMTTCWFLTQLLFQLPAGYLADRFDQRRLMIGMDLVRLAAVGSIPVGSALGFLGFPQLLVVVFIEGAASTVFQSASQVFIRFLMPPGQFARAASQAQLSFGVVSVLGPTLGGALYAVGHVVPFVVDTASYVVSGLLLCAVAARGGSAVSVASSASTTSEAAGQEPADQRVTAGLLWLWRQRATLRSVLFCTVLNLVGAAMGVVTLVVLTRHGTSAGVVGVVMGWSGAGVIAGSLLARRAQALGRWLYPAIGLLWTGALGAVSVSQSSWTIGVVLTTLAFASPAVAVRLLQILRDDAPAELYGRVLAAEQLVSTSLLAVAPLLAGFLLAAVGRSRTWLVFAALCLGATSLTVQRPPKAERAANTPPPGLFPAEPSMVGDGS